MTDDAVYRAFRVAYDGRPFHGFQRQPDVPTVSGAIREALSALGAPIDADPGYAAAGRTDRSVSALAQTIAVRCPTWLDPGALNGRLPDEIVAWAHADVPLDFHPRHDASSRTYLYLMRAPSATMDRMRAAAERLEGAHDFRHLTADPDRSDGRIDTIDVERADPSVRVTVRAPGFLRQQVRRIATLLRECGTGERDLAALDDVLGGEPLPGHRGIRPAAPEPLVLVDVSYEDVTFTAHPRGTELVKRRFRDVADRQRRHAIAMESISDRLP